MSNSQWERANQFGILLGSELPHFLFVGSWEEIMSGMIPWGP
jgi:hypothetical protein